MEIQKEFLTTAEAAVFSGYARGSLEKMRITGRGPKYLKMSHRKVLYPLAGLKEWLTDHTVTSTSDAPITARE